MLPHFSGAGFVTGQVIKRIIQTRQGPLVISATAEVIGDTIKLKNFSVAHEEGIGVLTNPGSGTLKAVFDALKGEFAAAGFSKVEVTALRITGASSPRLINKTIDLK